MSVAMAGISPARQRERFATKKKLTTAAQRQDKKMVRKLMELRKELNSIADTTRDPETARRLKAVVAGVVTEMEALESEDVSNNRLRADVDDAEARSQGIVSQPIALPRIERKWRP